MNVCSVLPHAEAELSRFIFLLDIGYGTEESCFLREMERKWFGVIIFLDTSLVFYWLSPSPLPESWHHEIV